MAKGERLNLLQADDRTKRDRRVGLFWFPIGTVEDVQPELEAL